MATKKRTSKAKQPNILVIWGDDIGISNLSCYTEGLRIPAEDMAGPGKRAPAKPNDVAFISEALDDLEAQLDKQRDRPLAVLGSVGRDHCDTGGLRRW